ncbi:hypothetical protein RLEG3_08655 (plasmid) [Rhizobium leguminosarum bv. trifolii WSM1689]|nr:hypothetical protein RLEG3_08655 [Rhizobium leguminosarum bv. trifolii WSM1689]
MSRTFKVRLRSSRLLTRVSSAFHRSRAGTVGDVWRNLN